MDGEEHSANAVLVWAAGLSATTAAVLLATKWWWRGERKSGGTGGTSARKPLARSSGVRVVCVQDSSSGSDGLLSGWGTPAGGGARDGKGGQASKWEQSKQKGDLGYYFAHHTSMKELAPEDYRMNGPRLLSKGDTAAADASDDKNRGGSASPPPVAPRRRAQQISSYSWEDYGEEVRLTFRQSSWNWAEVDEEEIEVQWGPRRLRLSIDSREYGLHTIDLPRLSGEVADVGVLKMKKKLVVALVKGGRGSYSKKAPWDKLQTDPAKPSD